MGTNKTCCRPVETAKPVGTMLFAPWNEWRNIYDHHIFRLSALWNDYHQHPCLSICCFFSGFAINELAALVVSGVCPAIATRISVGRTWGWQKKKEEKILTYAGLEPAIS